MQVSYSYPEAVNALDMFELEMTTYGKNCCGISEGFFFLRKCEAVSYHQFNKAITESRFAVK